MCEEDSLRRSGKGELLTSVKDSYWYNHASTSGGAVFHKKESPVLLGPDGNPIEKEPAPFGFRNV